MTADGSYFLYSKVTGAAAGLEFAWSEVVALRAGYDFLSEANHLDFGLGLRAGTVPLRLLIRADEPRPGRCAPHLGRVRPLTDQRPEPGATIEG